MAASGRVFRYREGGWTPYGEPLPEFAHAPITPHARVATWVVPRQLNVQVGDVLVAHEVAHRMLLAVPASDDAWTTVAQQAGALATADEVHAWLGKIELWLGQRLDPGVEWPVPATAAS